MADHAPLPKGRHALPPDQVREAQRLRLAVATAEAMAEQGYAGTPVAAILTRAGVSRETFYRLYDGKQACFLDALDIVGEVLVAHLDGDGATTPAESLDRYLDAIVEHPAFARLFLVEVHAAGAEAMRRRAGLQQRLVDRLARQLGARRAADRFACAAFVAAVSSMVTLPIATGDTEAVERLRRPLHAHLLTLAASR